jgi:hypothetical protein
MKITAYLPIYASARFELEVDKETWNALSVREKTELFRTGGEVVSGCLCWSCSGNLETDFVINDTAPDIDPTEFHFSEEDA